MDILNNQKSIRLPKKINHIKHVYHQFVILTERRDFLKNELQNRNIICGIHYPKPVHKQKAYKKFSNSMLKNTEEISKEILSLPIYPLLKKTDQTKIINIINKLK